MLTFTNSEERQSHGFHLLGMAKSSQESVRLISDNTSLISPNLSSLLASGGEDYCSFYSGPSDDAILSFAEQAESCGSIAYEGSESCGSIAYDSMGSSVSCSYSDGGFSGGACSYSC